MLSRDKRRERRKPGMSSERDEYLLRMADRYGWDMPRGDALANPDRIILRVLDIGALADILACEKIIGRERLAEIVQGSNAGALRPKSWDFWHYRLGLSEADSPPPSPPVRRSLQAGADLP